MIRQCKSLVQTAFRDELSPRLFCHGSIAIVTTCLVAVAILNFVVDPYAQYAPDVCEPLVQTSRAQKVQLLSEMHPAPDGLILGSSRVMKLEPDFFEQAIGGRFFNAGMNHAKPEDYLAMLRHYQSTFGRNPKYIVVGIDVNAFSDINKTDARLLSNKELMEHIAASVPLSDRFQRWRELFSWQQTKMSVTSLRTRHSEEEPPVESFRRDGLIVYHQREREFAEGTYDFDGALDYTKREYAQLFLGYDRLSKRRCDLFLDFVSECNRSDCQLMVFVTPMHPELIDYVSKSTTYAERKSELLTFVNQHIANRDSKHSIRFADLSEISTFRGDPIQFVDGVHPLEPNTRRMIQELIPHQLVSHQSSDEEDAVQ